ncbi:MAG: hypothetical protein WC306_00745 [Candidatus Paceibacterota bacterium]|jgi:hypothetical protein
MSEIFIVNSLGEREPFSWRKVYQSAVRVGAQKALAKHIASQIEKEVYNNIRTSEIFKKVKEYLYQDFPKGAMRFSLKEAMRKLGPSGFPFEKYISEIFKRLGFAVQINQHLPGKCVLHEIDLLAKIDKQLLIGECKFHSLPGSRVDLKVALSTYARYLDLNTGNFFKKESLKKLKIRPILITNTKFTSEAIRYAECMKIDLLGWRYPEDRGLEYVIESNKFYPITILPSLKSDVLNVCGKEQIMLAQDLLSIDINKCAKKAGISEKRLLSFKEDAETLMKD